jgi:hypothetical protein
MIEIHPNALFYHELKYLNKLVQKSKFEPSKVGFGQKSETRSSSQMDVSNDFLVMAITNRIVKEHLKDVDVLEFTLEANIVKYEVGEYVALHHDEVDYDDESGKLLDLYENEPTYRKYSMIINLTDDFKGGILHFPELNLHIYPKIGKMVLFKNVLDNFKADKKMVHESMTIIKGCKVVLVLFISVEKPIMI